MVTDLLVHHPLEAIYNNCNQGNLMIETFNDHLEGDLVLDHPQFGYFLLPKH